MRRAIHWVAGFFILLGLPTLASATNVSGAITTNTTWNTAGSPYIVTGTVTVSNNATLTIQAGVQVKFNANTGLVLGSGTAGILNAQGTSGSLIIFTTNNGTPAPGQWNGISFTITTSASIIDYAVIEYGGAGGNNNNIRVSSSTPTISNSTIRHSDGYGLYVTGTGVTPVISNNTFSNNGGFPVRLQLPAFATSLTGNTFTSNGTQAIELFGGVVGANLTIPNAGVPYHISTTGVTVNNNATLTISAGVTWKFNAGISVAIGFVSTGTLVAQGSAASPITFTTSNATPAAGQWGGLSFAGTTQASMLDYAIVEYGGSASTDANIAITSGAATIRHCTIRHSDGAGINLTTSTTPIIEHNTISSNKWGIKTSNIGQFHVIRHNAISGSITNGLNSVTGNPVDARLNWWGHATGPSGTGPGSGDSISGAIAVFEPWLAQTPSETLKWNSGSNAPDPVTQDGNWTTVFGSLNQSAGWTVTLKDSTGATVKTFTGSGSSVAQDWYGDDASSTQLANGTYSYEASATSGSDTTANFRGNVTLNLPLPIANITVPTPNQVLAAGSITVTGTASGTGFTSYKVEYGVGLQPTAWTLIVNSTSSVTNGTLATWNTPTTVSPIYTLKLTTTKTGGVTATDTVTIGIVSVGSPTDTPDPFSPNANGVKETTTISSTANYVVNWTLTIKNGGGTTVRTYTGSGSAISQPWDGQNGSGVVQSHGTYSYELSGTEPESGVTANWTGGQVILDTTAPTATISSPTQSQTISSGAPLSIVGTATDETSFSGYTLSYGAGASPSSFTQISQGSTVVSGTLGTFDPNIVAPGVYTFRLQATDTAGTVTTLDRQVTLNHVRISAVSVSPTSFDPSDGETTTISYTLDPGADVTVKIYDDPTKQLVRTLSLLGQLAGARTAVWDGENSSSAIAPLEAYYFTIEATGTADPTRTGLYNNATTPQMQSLATVTSPAANSTNFNPYKNDDVEITYSLSVPGRLKIQIQDFNNQPMRTLINSPRAAGSQLERWDGRRDNGRMYAGAFHVFFVIEGPLPVNTMILTNEQTGAVSFLADPFLIQPVFEEISTFTYSLTKDASVTLTITDPNGNTVRTLLSSVAKTAGSHSIEWDGRDDNGKAVAVDGDYRVNLTLVDTASGFSATHYGTLVVYK